MTRSGFIFCASCGEVFDATCALTLRDHSLYGDGAPAGEFELYVCSSVCFSARAAAKTKPVTEYEPEDMPTPT